MTHAHYALLASLYALTRGGTRPSQRELADFCGLDVVYVSKLVRMLERAGLLRRADHPDDPRAFQLDITPEGTDLAVSAAIVVRQLYDQLLLPIGGRTGKQADALMNTLEGLVEHADAFNRSAGSPARESSTRRPLAVRKRKAVS